MKQILIILGLFASVTTFAQSPRIKLNQITKDTVKGSVLISSPTDSGMVYSRDFYIAYGADTVLILYGDTLAATSGIISSVLSDGVTITGDGTTGNELKVDTLLIATIKALNDSLATISASTTPDNVTITGDGSVGNPLKVDTATVISTIQGLVDTLAARGYLTANQTITLSGDVTGSGTTAITATVVDDSHNHIISNVDFLQDSLNAKANDSDLANYVTLSGTETITGAKTFTNTFTQSGGDANFDSGTLFVDESANNVGIGTTSPLSTAKLQVKTATDINVGIQTGTTNPSGIKINAFNDAGTANIPLELNGSILSLKTGETERMHITSTGNLGLGVTPSAWISVFRAIQLGQGSSLWGAATGNNAGFDSNVYVNTSGASIYVGSTFATRYQQNDGTHAWYTAPSGTAGAVISFTQAMKLDASGNLGIGTSPATKLHVDGTIRYTNRPAAGTITAIGFDTNGDLKASSSSQRYKYNIRPYNKGLDIVNQLNPVYFSYNGESRDNVGFIAEDFDNLGLSELTLYQNETIPEGIIYSNITALLTKAIQEQQTIIETQQTEIDQLKTLIQSLTTRIENIENN